MGKNIAIARQTDEVSLSNPNDIMKFANSLKTLIMDKKLYTPIQGKNYINVEGWQIAGALVGITPFVEKVEQLQSAPGEYKYRAEVSLRDKEGKTVGYGMALCSNREPGKKGFAEYAVMSMAQTRAVGKALRMSLGWLLKVAGYETTPYEEMEATEVAQKSKEEPQPVVTQKGPSVRDVSYAVDKLGLAKDMAELKEIYKSFPHDIMVHADVVKKKDEMKAGFASEADIMPAESGA
ncbi:hypothetical protein J6S37_00505 [Candidatus Saccharibacteria bacterium]|nr:hypothetical protein [Candidatus Saccharibacteria bacterium]